MSSRLITLRNLLRRIAWVSLPPFIVLIAVSLLVAQFTELSTKNEVLSLSSFIVLLSFSALAFNWCRVAPTFTHEQILKRIYQAGIDLFLASLLALTATFFAWLKLSFAFVPAFLSPVIMLLHWLFFSLSMILFLIAIFDLLRSVKAIHTDSP